MYEHKSAGNYKNAFMALNDKILVAEDLHAKEYTTTSKPSINGNILTIEFFKPGENEPVAKHVTSLIQVKDYGKAEALLQSKFTKRDAPEVEHEDPNVQTNKYKELVKNSLEGFIKVGAKSYYAIPGEIAENNDQAFLVVFDNGKMKSGLLINARNKEQLGIIDDMVQEMAKDIVKTEYKPKKAKQKKFEFNETKISASELVATLEDRKQKGYTTCLQEIPTDNSFYINIKLTITGNRQQDIITFKGESAKIEEYKKALLDSGMEIILTKMKLEKALKAQGYRALY